MLVAVPSSGATLNPHLGDQAAAPRPVPVSDLGPDLVRLALVLVVDVLFVVGVLLPYATYDGEFVDQWLPNVFMLPVVLTTFFLPWVTCGSAVFSGYRLWRSGLSSPVSRAVCLCVVVLAAAGLVAYFSPWGIDAIRWLMDSD